MGQTNSQFDQQNKQLQLVRTVPNGSIVRLVNSNELYFYKEYSFTNEETYQLAFLKYSRELTQKHQHILALRKTTTRLQNTFCSTFYKIGLLYEYFDHTLHHQIEMRRKKQNIFEEKQVWSVLCSCVLATSQIVKQQGRCHSALSTSDIKLTKNGEVKLLSTEMVGMSGNHDMNKQGNTKQLVVTILNCLLMEQIANDCPSLLKQLIQNSEFTDEMKNILSFMLMETTTFLQLQDYLYRLAQDQNDSLNSCLHTPILNGRTNFINAEFSKIPEQSREDQSLMILCQDQEDTSHQPPIQQINRQRYNADDQDMIDLKSKRTESHLSAKRKQTFKNQELSRVKSNINSKATNNQNCLFTDPILLHLLEDDLQAMKKRRSNGSNKKTVSLGNLEQLTLNNPQSVISLREKQKTSQNRQPELQEKSNNFMNYENISFKKNETKSNNSKIQTNQQIITENRLNEVQQVSQIYMRGKYEGTKKNNMRHGKGILYYKEGGKYVGNWKENKMDGFGVLYYPDDSIAYDGQWQNDQLHGTGTLFNQDCCELIGPFNYKDWSNVYDCWIKYQGLFQNDLKNGEGQLHLSNGQIFKGIFLNDMITGQGYIIRKDGGKIKGIWKENKLIRLL